MSQSFLWDELPGFGRCEEDAAAAALLVLLLLWAVDDLEASDCSMRLRFVARREEDRRRSAMVQ